MIIHTKVYVCQLTVGLDVGLDDGALDGADYLKEKRYVRTRIHT